SGARGEPNREHAGRGEARRRPQLDRPVLRVVDEKKQRAGQQREGHAVDEEPEERENRPGGPTGGPSHPRRRSRLTASLSHETEPRTSEPDTASPRPRFRHATRWLSIGPAVRGQTLTSRHFRGAGQLRPCLRGRLARAGAGGGENVW